MNGEELIKRIEKIKDQIFNRAIVPRSIDLIRQYGRYEKDQKYFFGFREGRYNGIDDYGKKVFINYKYNFDSELGGGQLRVLYDDKKVFVAEKAMQVLVKELNLEFAIILDDFYIYSYTPGKWEEHLKKLSKVKAIRPEKNESDNEELKSSLVSRLKKRFPSLEER